MKLEWLDSLKSLNETVKTALINLPILLNEFEEKEENEKSSYLHVRIKGHLSALEDAQRVSKSDSLRLEFARVLSVLEELMTSKQIDCLVDVMGIEEERLSSRFQLAQTLVRNVMEGVTDEEKELASRGSKRS
jgi:hypothetical protein